MSASKKLSLEDLSSPEEKHTMSEIEGNSTDAWISGQQDVRERAPLILRILADLCSLSGDGRKMEHWRKIANFIEEFKTPIVSEQDVKALNEFKGFGPRSFHVISEIQRTGYLDWMDELAEEVRIILEKKGDEQRLASFMEIQQSIERLRESRRVEVKQRILYRAPRTRSEHRIQSKSTESSDEENQSAKLSGKKRKVNFRYPFRN
jgi:hypothetical protein